MSFLEGESIFAAGDVLSARYRVVRFVAHGGMGEVYEAEDLELRTRVAVKLLRPEIAQDQRAVDRFKREIALSHRITHPNVCRVFDLVRGLGPGGHEITFLTMEFLDGETLEARVRRDGRLSTGEALPLARQIAGGLAAAHAAGVVHRDLKPSNVMLVHGAVPGDGIRAVVMDFGLALAPEGQSIRMTETELVMGSPAYMSPEQAEGQKPTPSSDLYSLGVVLFELVTGDLPHEGESPLALLLRRLREPAPSPRAVVPDLDPRWETVILRCLEVDPAARFASVSEIVPALTGPMPASGPSPASEPEAAPGDARPPLTVWAGLRGVALVAVAALILLARGRRETPSAPEPGPRNPVQLTSSAGLDTDPSFSPDGRSIAYASDQSGSFEIYVRPVAANGREIQITTDGRQNFQPSWSPDGQTLVYSSMRGRGIWSIPASGGTPRRITDFGSRPAWSPDGKRIAFQSSPLVDLSPYARGAPLSSVLLVVDVATGKTTPLTRAGVPQGGHGTPAWSPDGRQIAFTADDRLHSVIWSIALADGALLEVAGHARHNFDPVYSPRGDALYHCASSASGNFELWKVLLSKTGAARGNPIQISSSGLAGIKHPSVSPDGRLLSYSALATTSNLSAVPLDAAGDPAGPPHLLTASAAKKNSRPAFSPDARRIAFYRWSPGAASDVWTIDADGKNAVQLTTDPADDFSPSWFPDGARVAFLSNRNHHFALWASDVATPHDTPVLDTGQDMDAACLSPDGKRVAFHARTNGVVNTWVATLGGGRPRQVSFGRDLIGFPCWSPDGTMLAVEAARAKGNQVSILPVSGGEPTQLTDEAGESWPHSWSPTGDRIAFAAQREGLWNVWWVARGTRQTRQLTRYTRPTAFVRYPAWAPSGDQIVYEYAETTGNVWTIGVD